MELKWIFQNVDQVKNVLFSFFSEESEDDIEQLKESIGESVELVFDLLREPLAEAGIDLPRSRALLDTEKQTKLRNQLARLQEILPYEPQEDME